jgi:ABC-type uncharacterized transport system involved in gliding motility auxiliary subunit
VQITYYVTANLKSINPVFGDIEEMLRDYETFSHGRIKLAIYDPVRDNRLTEAQSAEIVQFATVQQEAGQSRTAIVYSGIVLQYLDRNRVLPIVYSINTLEYELTGLIRQIINNRLKKIGFLVDKIDFDMPEFEKMASSMQPYFDMQELEKGKDLPEGIDAILVIGGANLNQFELFPIDQYIMRGGRALFATDRINIDVQSGKAAPFAEMGIFEMLKTYGVSIEPELLMENEKLALPIATSGGRMNYNYFFPAFAEYAAKDHPITANIREVRFLWASPLTLALPSSVEAKLLCATSNEAVRIKNQFPIDPNEVALAYNNLRSSTSSTPVVVALSGIFPSYFKNRTIPNKEGEKRKGDNLITSSTPSHIIIAGDSDFAGPGFIDINNTSFLCNCLEWLANDEDILSIPVRLWQDFAGKVHEKDWRKP